MAGAVAVDAAAAAVGVPAAAAPAELAAPAQALQALGFAWPTPAALLASIVFGVIGYAAFRHGKRIERPAVRWLGVVLMLFPYAIRSTGWLYTVGALLCAALFIAARR